MALALEITSLPSNGSTRFTRAKENTCFFKAKGSTHFAHPMRALRFARAKRIKRSGVYAVV